jgi:osmoprotectant transport system substrate-binding protein
LLCQDLLPTGGSPVEPDLLGRSDELLQEGVELTWKGGARPMQKVLRALIIVVALFSIALVAVACGDDGEGGGREGPTIRVGAFDFSESHVLAEIYAQALAAEEYSVNTDYILPGSPREITKPALESGQLDLVPEYVGTLLTFLGGEPTSDGAQNHAEAKELFEAAGVTLLDIAPAQDTNAIVANKETADKYDLEKVSDLAPIASELHFAGPPECPERQFCLIGLEEVYGIEFGEFTPIDFGPRVTALEEGAVDVALLFSTDAAIADKGFVLLEDDKGLQPAENISPAIRIKVLDAYDEDLPNLLNSVSAKITTEGLTALNKKVQVDKEDPDDVAGDWLRENGFVE